MATKKKKVIEQLTDWEWTTLVGAWRNYEYGHTITSATFPEDIVSRYFGPWNNYSDDVRKLIARQFAVVDHGRRGAKDWDDSAPFSDIDGKVWRKLYNFLRAYWYGFSTLTLEHGSVRQDGVLAFRSDGRWYPVDKYTSAPWREVYCPDEVIKAIQP